MSLDWADLAGTLKQVWGQCLVDASIIHCSLDSYNHRGWTMDCYGLSPGDILLLCDTDLLVASLLEILRDCNDNETSKKRPNRGAPGWFKGGKALDETGRDTSDEIRLRDIASCMKQLKVDYPISLVGLPLRWPTDIYDLTGPLDYLGKDGAGGAGSGPGIAVGAAMALKNSGRIPVAILGDGDYLMGVNALWTAARYHVPLLIVVSNNRSCHNCEVHQMKTAQKRNRPVDNRWIGEHINDPPGDIMGIARAQGFDGEGPIATPGALPSALKRGIEAVLDERCHVVDVMFKPD